MNVFPRNVVVELQAVDPAPPGVRRLLTLLAPFHHITIAAPVARSERKRLHADLWAARVPFHTIILGSLATVLTEIPAGLVIRHSAEGTVHLDEHGDTA